MSMDEILSELIDTFEENNIPFKYLETWWGEFSMYFPWCEGMILCYDDIPLPENYVCLIGEPFIKGKGHILTTMETAIETVIAYYKTINT